MKLITLNFTEEFFLWVILKLKEPESYWNSNSWVILKLIYQSHTETQTTESYWNSNPRFNWNLEPESYWNSTWIIIPEVKRITQIWSHTETQNHNHSVTKHWSHIETQTRSRNELRRTKPGICESKNERKRGFLFCFIQQIWIYFLTFFTKFLLLSNPPPPQQNIVSIMWVFLSLKRRDNPIWYGSLCTSYLQWCICE